MNRPVAGRFHARPLLLASFLAAVPIAALANAQGAGPFSLSDVAVDVREGTTGVLIKTPRTPRYQASLLDKPPRLVIDFTETEHAWRGSPLVVAADPVKEIRGSQYKKGIARIVIELTRTSDYLIEADAEGLRVILRPLGAARASPSEAGARSVAAAAAPVTTPAPAGPAKPLLYGVIHSEGGWIAYIEDPATRTVAPYRIGVAVGGRTIDTIEDERGVLKGPEGTIEIRLSDDNPGAP